MQEIKKVVLEPHLVNIHLVRGDAQAIAYLKNADFHFVEGLFFRAKMTGRTEFEFHGESYRMVKNRDITYTLEKVPERPVELEGI